MLKILSQEKAARRCEFPTVHGVIQTPAFMNVATCGAIKGAVSAYDLKELHCQVQLCNTYHLHVRSRGWIGEGFGRPPCFHRLAGSDPDR